MIEDLRESGDDLRDRMAATLSSPTSKMIATSEDTADTLQSEIQDLRDLLNESLDENERRAEEINAKEESSSSASLLAQMAEVEQISALIVENGQERLEIEREAKQFAIDACEGIMGMMDEVHANEMERKEMELKMLREEVRIFSAQAISTPVQPELTVELETELLMRIEGLRKSSDKLRTRMATTASSPSSIGIIDTKETVDALQSEIQDLRSSLSESVDKNEMLVEEVKQLREELEFHVGAGTDEPLLGPTSEDLISRCYSYIYSEHSLDQLHYPSQKSDENVFEFLHSLENTPSNNTGAQEQPDIRTHMLRLKETYLALDILCTYNLNRLWDEFRRWWELEGYNVYHAREVFLDQRHIWLEILFDSRKTIAQEFYDLYDNMEEEEQNQFATYAEEIDFPEDL
ncbi:hypothetical protein FRC03_003163 [Tulasnella sp. 419]|nr:hypothetical protein FRC03_003163 [Tulasnella sp. 419]